MNAGPDESVNSTAYGDNTEENTTECAVAAVPCCMCARDGGSGKKKHRQPEEQQALLNRLRRIEGQVRGVQNMLADDAYCTDILTQISAIQSALNSFSRELLERHIRTCVVTEIRAGDDGVVSDLVKTIQKLMK